MSKKMTAVDFIIETLAKNGVLHSSDIDKAKAMEKEQIEEAFNLGYDQWTVKTSEQYYKETYEQE